VLAPEALPPFPAAILDGYAVRAADGAGEFEETAWRVTAGTDAAGLGYELRPGQVAPIATGAPMPPGADAVVKIEDTELLLPATSPQRVRVLKGVAVGASIRPVGKDIVAGQLVLPRGALIGAAEIGLLATTGVQQVAVHARPRVGVLSTGDELHVVPGQATAAAGAGGGGAAVPLPLPPAMIRDTNRPALLALLREAGAAPVDLGVAADTDSSLRAAVEGALGRPDIDVLVTSGGVSMGERDLLKELLAGQAGATVHFGRLAMKPGKPTTFATVPAAGRMKLAFALPGNPVSAVVTSKLLLLPALRRLAGAEAAQCLHPQVQATLAAPIKLDPERPEYHRAQLCWHSGGGGGGGGGGFVATSTGVQMSSRLLSMRGANALLCLPKGAQTLPVGTMVTALVIGALPPAAPELSHHRIPALCAAAAPASAPAALAAAAEAASAPPAIAAAPSVPVAPALVEAPARCAIVYCGGAVGSALVLGGGFEAGDIRPSHAGVTKSFVQERVETCCDGRFDLLLFVGGSGWRPEDVVPDVLQGGAAQAGLLHREAPGLVAVLTASEGSGLTRFAAGTRHGTMILALSECPAAQHAWEAVRGAVGQAIVCLRSDAMMEQ
jgi:gephyrin